MDKSFSEYITNLVDRVLALEKRVKALEGGNGQPESGLFGPATDTAFAQFKQGHKLFPNGKKGAAWVMWEHFKKVCKKHKMSVNKEAAIYESGVTLYFADLNAEWKRGHNIAIKHEQGFITDRRWLRPEIEDE